MVLTFSLTVAAVDINKIMKSAEILLSLAAASFLLPNTRLLLIPLTRPAVSLFLLYLQEQGGGGGQRGGLRGGERAVGDTDHIDLCKHVRTHKQVHTQTHSQTHRRPLKQVVVHRPTVIPQIYSHLPPNLKQHDLR